MTRDDGRDRMDVDAPPHLVIAGASGVVGRHLVAAARDRWRVTVLTRRVDGTEPPGAAAVAWNPSAARDGDAAGLERVRRALEGAGALVNLAGSSIHRGRFGAAHRERILTSRVDATTTLRRAAEVCTEPPRVWLQGSAVGAYGDRGEEELHDASPLADEFFLAEVARRWEAAAAPAAGRSRLVIARLGMVLAPDAPAWRRLVLPVRAGVGGPLGGGRQWWPWIHADDLAAALLFLLRPPPDPADRLPAGPFVLAAPEPVRQIDLTRAIAARLRRPALVPVPAFALRIALGGLADALLLPSARVRPRRLLAAGFRFRHPTIGDAVPALLRGTGA